MIKIPFIISPHEKALAEVYLHLNTLYLKESSRWRIAKTERVAAGKVSITGKLFVEELRENNTYIPILESMEYTVNESSTVENIAYCQAMIKLIYFCLASMGAQPDDWRFVNEDQKAIKNLYKPEVSWEDDLSKSGISIEEMFKRRGSLQEIKMYVNSTSNQQYPLPVLIAEAKKACKTTKLTAAQLLRFVYGQNKYRAYKQIVSDKKPATRHRPPAKTTSPSPVSRSAGEVVSLRERFQKLGVGKSNYKEKLPKQSVTYRELSLFLANANEAEIAEAIFALS